MNNHNLDKMKFWKPVTRFCFRYLIPALLIFAFPLSSLGMGYTIFYLHPYLLAVLPALTLKQCIILAIPHGLSMLFVNARKFRIEVKKFRKFKYRRYIYETLKERSNA